MTDFIVVYTSFAYNAIIGRAFLSGIRGVLSIYHNVLKFSVGTGVGEVRGDQQATHRCYVVFTNPTELAKQCAHVTNDLSREVQEEDHDILEEGEVLNMIVEKPEEEDREWASGQPVEELEEIPIMEDDPTKVVKIGGVLESRVRESLVGLLKEYNDIFAWSHDEMP